MNDDYEEPNEPTADEEVVARARSASSFKDYLGDGLYAQFDGHHIVLTAENGLRATDTVYLEPACVRAIARFARRCGYGDLLKEL